MPRSDVWRRHFARFAIPSAGLLATAALTVLALTNDLLYFQVMKLMMEWPGNRPFMDWSVTPTVLSCAARGVDIYLPNDCSPLFNYSPAWLLLPPPPGGPVWDMIIGFSIALIFFLSLALLALPRSRFEFCVRLAAALSSSVALAVERGNVDVIFYLVLLAGSLLIARSGRLTIIGYGAFILAALLKFYPAAALFAVLRESPARFVAVVATALGAGVWLFATFRPELAIVLSNLPVNNEWTMEFNGKEFARVAAGLLAQLPSLGAMMPAIAAGLRVVLIAAMTGAAIFLWRCCVRRGTRLPDDATVLVPMVVGAAVIIFCFLAGQNYLYRGIFLLPIIPGLFAVARGSDPKIATVIEGSCVLMAICWMPPIKEAFVFVRLWKPLVEGTAWFAYQIVWWWIATVLGTILVAYFVESRIGGLLLHGLRSGRGHHSAATF